MADAFTWLWVAARDVALFAADVDGSAVGLQHTITIIYLVLTFGWTGSPGEWMIPPLDMRFSALDYNRQPPTVVPEA